MTTVLDKTASAAADELEIATFYVDDALLGVAIEEVEEINHHMDLTPVPHAPACVRGLINLRGEVVTVIDLRVVLGLEPAALGRGMCNVVVRWKGERVGILADRVGDVIRARRSSIEPPPANVIGADGRFFQGVCKLERELLVLLDIDKTLAIEPVAN